MPHRERSEHSRTEGQKAAYEARYKDLAHDADKQVEQAQSEALAATDAFIERNRVRGGGVSAPVAAASDSSTGVPESVPAGIIVGEADVRACSALYPYAVAARAWALDVANASGNNPAHP